jgi:hypothetical protein
MSQRCESDITINQYKSPENDDFIKKSPSRIDLGKVECKLTECAYALRGLIKTMQ